MSEKLPVIAAVPNYNMGQQLIELLPELAAQNYDDIFVLDDASEDGSREVVEDYNMGGGVQFVESAANRGAGAARNLIINALARPAIIHFMDADVHLGTDDMAGSVREALPSEPFGFVGGLSVNSEGMQSVWNYGPRQGLRGDIGALIQKNIEPLLATDPQKAKALRQRFNRFLDGWPDPLEVPVRREVFWNIEQNLVFDSETFRWFDGFDERLREHEIQDLAIRIAGAGIKNFFDPSLKIIHKNGQNVRNYNRRPEMLKTEFQIARKHGLRNWLAN